MASEQPWVGMLNPFRLRRVHMVDNAYFGDVEKLARRSRLRLVPPERCQQEVARPAFDVLQHTRVPGMPQNTPWNQ